MTHTGPGTDPVGAQPNPTQPAPVPPGSEQAGWNQQPQQLGPWDPPQQPWAPQQQGAWAPPPAGASAAPGAKPSGVKKWLRIGVSIAVAGVVGLGSFVGFGGPEVGDCVQMQGQTSFDVVDCGSAEAEYRVVGVEDEEQNYPDFMADQDTCSGSSGWEVALWIGGMETEPGTVYCAEPV